LTAKACTALDLAARIIETQTAKFDLSRYQERYENALLDLVKAKQVGERSNRSGCRNLPTSST
jgi:DNA end-binding protein Ku